MNAGFGAPLSKGATVFAMRHADGEPENFQLLSGDFAEAQRNACSDLSMIREVPQDEWEASGFEIQEYKGSKVVVQVFDKTEQLIEKKNAKTKVVAQADDTKQDDFMRRLDKLEARNAELEKRLEGNNLDKADKAEAKALAKETRQSKDKAAA